MKLVKSILFIFVLVLSSGIAFADEKDDSNKKCDGGDLSHCEVSHDMAKSSKPIISGVVEELPANERIKLGLPLEECPGNSGIHTTLDDERAAASLPPEVYIAITAYLKVDHDNYDARGNIYAARSIGQYILLWIQEPYVRDGGRELIYSTKGQRIVGNFCGGYRG